MAYDITLEGKNLIEAENLLAEVIPHFENLNIGQKSGKRHVINSLLYHRFADLPSWGYFERMIYHS